MKKKTIGAMILAAGAAATLAAAATPGVSSMLTKPADHPVSGITAAAEQFASEDATTHRGVAEAIRLCMAKAGYDYTPAPSGQQPVDLKHHIGFTTLTVETARASGYASLKPQGPGEPATNSELGRLFADPAFQTALNGGGPSEQNVVQSSEGTGMHWGGCTAEGITAIYGNANDYMRATGLAFNSLLVATNAAAADADIHSAVDAWKKCMSTTAFPYSLPDEAASAGLDAGGQKELKIAVTDATCRADTNFDAKLTTVLDKYLTTRMKELQTEVAAVKQIRRDASARAAALLG
ncbi:hypothetical protein AB4Y77_08845 [Paenarthrobacter sp. YAF11_1]|uniref:hypothetical protein n=1 Tax=Micrococcaceae TaxID=1268 RepID=UPI002883469D|nr:MULTISPECIES: hypothetical protein [unclassified Arthrobacter]